MDISVVVPLYNEEESLPELYAWIDRVMQANHFTYEVIFVNDGSTDNTAKMLVEFADDDYIFAVISNHIQIYDKFHILQRFVRVLHIIFRTQQIGLFAVEEEE